MLELTISSDTPEDIFKAILERRKTIELRVFSKQVSEIRKGMRVRLRYRQKVCEVLVKEVAMFSDLDTALNRLDSKKIAPGYSVEQIREFFWKKHSAAKKNEKVVAIKFSRV